MDNKKALLDLLAFCCDKQKHALEEASRYTGFASNLAQTKEEEKLNGYQMSVMKDFTIMVVDYWEEQYESAINSFIEQFETKEEAEQYAREQGYWEV